MDTRAICAGAVIGLTLIQTVAAADDQSSAPAPYPPATHTEANSLRLGADRSSDDGVVFDSEIAAGKTRATLTVTVNNADPSARLDAWIDFNNDGFWGQNGEKIIHQKSILNGVHSIHFAVPAGSPSGQTFARFRISSSGDHGPGGTASDGEVEDHQVEIQPPAAAPLRHFSPRKVIYTPDRLQMGATGVADMDNDGDPDIVATSDQVIWLENEGGGVFSANIIREPLGFSAGDSARVGQLDGYGEPDIVYRDTGPDKAFWFENDEGFFLDYEIAPSSRCDYQFVDANQDGHTDLLRIEAGSNIVWHLNQGDQTFTSAPGSDNLDILGSIDLDRDGDLDLLSSENKLTWHENIGDLIFTTHTIGTLDATVIHPADLDGDGDIDLIVKDDSYELRWYENDGAEVFTPHSIGPGNRYKTEIATADLDGDGDLDILTDRHDSGTTYGAIGWYENQPGTTFEFHLISHASYRGGIHPSDLDGDGDLDIVAGQYHIVWFENLNVMHDFAADSFSVAEGDTENTITNVTVTRSGDTTIASEITVLLSGAIPDEAEHPVDYVSQTATVSFAANEIEKSADIVIAGDIFTESDENLALGLDSPGVIRPTATLVILNDDIDSDGDSLSDKAENTVYSTDPTKADSDDDGITDDVEIAGGTDPNIADSFDLGDLPLPFPIAAHAATGPVLGSQPGGANGGIAVVSVLQPGKADCTISITVTAAPAGAKLDAWIDFDGDQNFGSARERIASRLALVNGVQNFSFEIPAEIRPGSVASRFRISSGGVAGPSGVASDGETEDYQLQIQPPAAGAQAFSARPISLVDEDFEKASGLAHFDFENAADLAAADFDQDGNIDLLLLSLGDAGLDSGGGIVILKNTGMDSFMEYPVLTTEVPNQAHIADLDGDGDLDFLTGVRGKWFENTGGMAFVERSINQFSLHTSADIDGDGDLDLSPFSPSSWGRNDGDAISFTPRIFAGGDPPRASYFVDIDQDGDLDAIARTNQGIDLLRNDGRLNFSTGSIDTPAPARGHMFISDIDADGRPDIVSNDAETDAFQWHRNLDGIDFQANPIATSHPVGRLQHTADIDGDGDIDLLSSPGWIGPLAWHQNDGAGGFTEHLLPFESRIARAITADIDADGDLDVMALSSDARVYWIENKGTVAELTYEAWAVVAFSLETPAADRLADADPDGDGNSNLAEFFFFTDPLAPGPSPLAFEDGALDFTRRKNIDLSVTYQSSNDLLNWQDFAGEIIIVPGEETETVRLTIPAGSRFVRIKLSM